MDIFTIQKTEDEIKIDEIRRCADFRKRAVEAHISSYEEAFNDFWNNSLVTPQEQCDALGNSAVQFFIVSATTQQYILALKPDWTPPFIPYEFTCNEDGTVVIGNKIEIITEEPIIE